ncbi:MAG: Glycerol-3-phosphate acyltransferase [Wolbachia endosymbiont of Ctenocephalides orientis wCori]|nr:MAG: Glycerol-3-phosphate acyltransferase [Wolbachia endosymbiont of Ctenocephalides orientis wCori]
MVINIIERYVILTLSYVLGSIPFSLIITKAKGIDLRKAGSGNVGATNVLRTGNKFMAALALLLDSLKGFIAVYIAQQFFSNDDLYIHLSAILAVLGHMFPIWLKFKGGKGVATTLGVLIMLDINIFLIFIFTWATIFFAFRYSSLASLSATAAITVTLFFLQKNLFLTLLNVGIMIFIKHHRNIMDLLRGKERKLF